MSYRENLAQEKQSLQSSEFEMGDPNIESANVESFSISPSEYAKNIVEQKGIVGLISQMRDSSIVTNYDGRKEMAEFLKRTYDLEAFVKSGDLRSDEYQFVLDVLGDDEPATEIETGRGPESFDESLDKRRESVLDLFKNFTQSEGTIEGFKTLLQNVIDSGVTAIAVNPGVAEPAVSLPDLLERLQIGELTANVGQPDIDAALDTIRQQESKEQNDILKRISAFSGTREEMIALLQQFKDDGLEVGANVPGKSGVVDWERLIRGLQAGQQIDTSLNTFVSLALMNLYDREAMIKQQDAVVEVSSNSDSVTEVSSNQTDPSTTPARSEALVTDHEVEEVPARPHQNNGEVTPAEAARRMKLVEAACRNISGYLQSEVRNYQNLLTDADGGFTKFKKALLRLELGPAERAERKRVLYDIAMGMGLLN